MKKKSQKPKLLIELTERKMQAQKTGETSIALQKFKPAFVRNSKKSPVGPSRGGRKGN